MRDRRRWRWRWWGRRCGDRSWTWWGCWSRCRRRLLRRFVVKRRRGGLLPDAERVDQESRGVDEQLDRGGIELRGVVADGVDIHRRRDLVLDHHRYEERAVGGRAAEAGREI